MRVLVVGAGIIGAACAAELARAGADVTVLAGQAASATQASFGWINASFYHDPHHHRLRRAGMQAWDRLAGRGDPLPMSRHGALWWEEQGTGLSRMASALRALDYPLRHLTRAEVSALEPALAEPPQEALQFPGEAAVDCAAAVRHFLESSDAITVLQGVDAERLIERGGRVTGVETRFGPLPADAVLLAAGNGTPALLASLGLCLPMLRRPGAIVTTAPIKPRLSSVLVTPDGEVRQLPDGRLISPAAANHQGDTSEAISEPLEAIARKTCARLAHLVGLSGLSAHTVAVADRPVPCDGLPVLGKAEVEGLYLAVMHSGATLAAIAGELLAAEIFDALTGDQRRLMAPYALARFQQEDPRTAGAT